MKQTVYQVTKQCGGLWTLDSRHGNEILATTIANGIAKAGSSARVIRVSPPAHSILRQNEERIVFEVNPTPTPTTKTKTPRRRRPVVKRNQKRNQKTSYTVIVLRLFGLGILGIGTLALMQMGAGL